MKVVCVGHSTYDTTLPMDLYNQLKSSAEEDYRSVPNYIRQVLKLYFQAQGQKTHPSG